MECRTGSSCLPGGSCSMLILGVSCAWFALEVIDLGGTYAFRLGMEAIDGSCGSSFVSGGVTAA